MLSVRLKGNPQEKNATRCVKHECFARGMIRENTVGKDSLSVSCCLILNLKTLVKLISYSSYVLK